MNERRREPEYQDNAMGGLLGAAILIIIGTAAGYYAHWFADHVGWLS